MGTKGKRVGGVLHFYDGVTHERVAPFAPVVFEDDFLGSVAAYPAAGSEESGQRWAKKTVQTAGAPAVALAADAASGAVQLSLDSTSEEQEAILYCGDQRNFSLEQGCIFEARVRLSVLPTLAAEAVWGLCGNYVKGPDNVTHSCFFTADGSGAIVCEKDDATSDQSAASGTTVLATAYHIYRIEFTSVSSIRFYINGAQVASGTTFAYAATGADAVLQPYFGLYKASGAGVGTMLVDYVRVWQNRS